LPGVNPLDSLKEIIMAQNKLTPEQALTKIQGIVDGFTSKGGRTISDQDVKLLKRTANKRSDTTMSQPRARGGAVRKMAKGGTAKKKK